MASRLRDLPQELFDMITYHAEKIPSGALVQFRRSADDTAQASEGDSDLSAGVVLYSLKPYYDIPGSGPRWSDGLVKHDTKETSLVNESGTIFTGIPDVASDLFGLALRADLNSEKEVLHNLRRMVWDGRLKNPESPTEDDTAAYDEEEPLRHLTWLSSATQKLSKLHHGKPIDFYVYAGKEDWSEHTCIPSEGFICWQGSLSGLPRIDSFRTKTNLKLVLEVSEYCQDDPNEGQGTSGPSQEFRDKLSTACGWARVADKGSVVGIHLVLDHPSDRAAKDRLKSWKDELREMGNSGEGEETSNGVNLQVYVGERPQLSFYYEL